MSTQQQYELALFLDQHVNLPRINAFYPVSWRVAYTRPTPNDLAEQLLETAEFQALRLGTWLDTPDGQLLAEAIEMVSPPFYRADVDLLIEALQIAAKEQQHRGRKNVALGIAALAIVGMLLGSSGE